MGRRGRETLSPKTKHMVLWHTIGRDLTRWTFPPEDQGVGTPHQASQPLRPIPEKWSHKTSSLETNWADVQGSQSTIGNWDSLLKLLICGLTHLETQQNNSSLKSANTTCEGESFANLEVSTREAENGGNTPQRWKHWWPPPNLLSPPNL